MAPVRVGGRATTADGDILVWSRAEGSRGTRWREGVEREGHLIRSLMLETSRAGRPTRLELTTAAGLLTVHPEPDERALHGNVVSAGGVGHIALAWSREHELAIDGSPASTAVMLERLSALLSIGAERGIEVVRIGDELAARSGRLTVRRRGQRVWDVIDPEADRAEQVTLDATGRPEAEATAAWPLEE